MSRLSSRVTTNRYCFYHWVCMNIMSQIATKHFSLMLFNTLHVTASNTRIYGKFTYCTYVKGGAF